MSGEAFSKSLVSNAAMAGGGANNGNIFSQLEVMMATVKNEAQAVENMKAKLKDFDELKEKVIVLEDQLRASEESNREFRNNLQHYERLNGQLRADMQSLNDLYNSEHSEFEATQQANSRLEQELVRIQQEMIFFQKESQKNLELRKQSQSLTTQVAQLQGQIDEERAAAAKTLMESGRRVQEVEEEKAKLSAHFWSLKEECNSYKSSLQEFRDRENVLQKKLLDLQSSSSQFKDRALMYMEDQRAAEVRGKSNNAHRTNEIAMLRGEVASLQNALAARESDLQSITNKLQSSNTEKSDLKLKHTEMSETIAVLKAQNHELERENGEFRHKLGLVSGEASRFTAEKEQLQREISRLETVSSQRETEFAKELQGMTAQRDEMISRLQAANQQCELVQAQLRESQTRYWEELKRVKDAEGQLVEEADHLSQELQEKSLRLAAVEAEKARLEDYVKGEVTSSSQMTSALRQELEKRVEELTQIRRERDTLREDNTSLEEKVKELDENLKKSEYTFKKTLESDRANLIKEVKAKMNKLKAMETEKEELLREHSGLMEKIAESQKELASMRIEMHSVVEQNKDMTRQNEGLKVRNTELLEEVKLAVRKEEGFNAEIEKAESRVREAQAAMEASIKESKKLASQQVMDLQVQVQMHREEVERMKLQVSEAAAAEKRAQAEVVKVRKDFDLANVSHEEMQQQIAKEVSSMRRDMLDQRNKMKLTEGAKAQLEMEALNMKNQLQKYQEELQAALNWSSELEAKQKATESEIQASRAQIAGIAKEREELKQQVFQLEDALAKKSTSMEEVLNELSKVEKEGQNDLRRLRVQLAQADQELQELRPMVPMLQKEIVEAKSRCEKLQSSTNSTVSGLLEELRRAEDAVSQERKRSQQELSDSRQQFLELQLQLERAKDNVEEVLSKAKSEKSEKEAKISQLESELERIKGASGVKDLRVEELERQHQIDRSRLHDFKDKLEAAERAVIDARAALELEQVQNKRLEKRLQTAATELAFYQHGGGGNNGPDSVNSYASKSQQWGSAAPMSTIKRPVETDLDSSFASVGSAFKLATSTAGLDSPLTSSVNIRKSSEFRLPGHAEEDDEEDKIGYNGNLDEEEKGYFNRPVGTSIRSSYDASAAIDRLSVAAAGGGGGGGGYSATSAMTEAVFLTGGDKTGFSPAKKSITPSKGNGSLSPKSSSSSAAFQSPMDRVSAALAARAAKDTNVSNRNSGAGGASTAATYIDKDFESSRRSSGMTMAINNGADDEPKGYGISAAEESIARTESYLRQRLGAAGASGASSAAPRGTGASAAVALAASKGDVGRNVKFRDNDGDDDEDMAANISLGAPSHKPMSPPSQSQSHSLMSDSTTAGKKSGGVVYPYETADGGGEGGVRRKSKTIKAEATANSMMTGSASQPALELPKIKTTSNGNASGNNSGRAGSGSSKRAKK